MTLKVQTKGGGQLHVAYVHSITMLHALPISDSSGNKIVVDASLTQRECGQHSINT
jgi:hypothetical protein